MRQRPFDKQCGYILLPVVLLISLVATAAFMLNNQSVLETGVAVSSVDVAQANYVADAGLQHALWQVEQAGCGPYTDISAEAFGDHSYSANISTNNVGGTITSYTVAVSDDAWVEEDEPGSNFGNGNVLSVYNELFDSTERRALYRFDIATSGIPTGAMVVSAIAKVFVVTPDPSRSVRIHQITADWNEDTVTWDNIASNHDSSSIGSIPANPSAGQYVEINITALVQGWLSGSIANQGIMLKPSFFSNDKLSEYTSKEYGTASQRPELVIKVTDGSLSNRADISATGTLASGISKNVGRKDIPLYQASPLSLTLQPGSEGKDAEIWDQQPNNNYGNAAETWVSSASNDKTRSLLHFNMNAIPAGAKIQSATLSLHRQSGSGANQPVSAHRILNPWNEDSVTWNSRETGTSWDTAGSDFENMAVVTTPVGPVNQRYEWNIKPLVQGWVDGSFQNYGVVLAAAIAGMSGERFYTSDDSDPTRHPSLTITYTCQCGVVCVSLQGSGNVLLVVGDAATPVAGDIKKQALFESWGYNINLIDDNANQAAFDAELTNNDVAYISETVLGPTLADKLAGTGKGVINEEEDQNSRLGLSSGGANIAGDSMEIIDNSHYITALFSNSVLPIFSAPMEAMLVTGTPAAGLQILGNFSGTASLALVDTGGVLGGSKNGENAAGRRVAIPVGSSDKFNWDYLNNNGHLIVQRAIQWGADGTGGSFVIPRGLWISTLDVTGTGVPGLDAWTAGEVVEVSDPNLAMEPDTTDGTFSSMFNLDSFASSGNTDIDAIHYVGTDIIIGSANSVAIRTGDVLLSTNNGETLTGSDSQSITVSDEDVFVFRPDVIDDYSAGSFIFLLDGSAFTSDQIVALSLVEKDTEIGNATVSQGQFLFGTVNSRDVQLLQLDDVGLGTTVANGTEFIDGASLSLGSEIRGMDLVEDTIDFGGQIITSGSIVLSLNNDDTGGVGDNLVPVDGADIFYLTVTTIGASPVADATLLFEGNDVNLDTSSEHLQALTLVNALLPATGTGPVAHWKLDEISGTAAVDSEGGHDGTLGNEPSWTTGQDNGALGFDGFDDYVDLTSDAELDDVFLGGATVMAWIYADGWGESDHGRILDKSSQTAGDRDGWMIAVNGDNPSVEIAQGFDGGRGYWRGQAGSFSLNEWVHVAFVYDASSDANDPVIYLNGVALSSIVEVSPSGTIRSDASISLRMGNHAQSTSRTFDGKIDDVRIYDRMLGSAEILAIAGAGGGGGGGGSGSGSCDGTFRDEFNVEQYDQNDGTLNWATDWEETGESFDPIGGDIRIDNDEGSYELKVRDDGQTIMREADLSQAGAATLSFDYWRKGLNGTSDYVAVEVSYNGGSSWTELDRFTGDADDGAYSSTSYTLDASSLSVNTRIRFLTPSSGMSNSNLVLFDNVQIQCSP